MKPSYEQLEARVAELEEANWHFEESLGCRMLELMQALQWGEMTSRECRTVRAVANWLLSPAGTQEKPHTAGVVQDIRARVNELDPALQPLATQEKEGQSSSKQAMAIMSDKDNPLYAKYQSGDGETVSLVNRLLMEASSPQPSASAFVSREVADGLADALELFDISGEGDEDFPDDTQVVVKFGRTTYYGLSLGDIRNAGLKLAAYRAKGGKCA